MKNQLENLSDMIGKTVTATLTRDYEREIMLVFGDSFICLYASSNGEGETEIDPIEFSFRNWWCEQNDIIEAGVVTKEEYVQWAEKKKRDADQRVEQAERQQYERLKKRFG